MRRSVSDSKAIVPENKNLSGVLNNYEAMKYSLCSSICKSDASSMSENVSRYVSENSDAYYILINSWILQARSISSIEADDLSDAIVQNGLIPIIGQMSDCANRLIACGLVAVEADIPSYAVNLLLHCAGLQQALQICRFPKRFSPVGATKVRDKTIQSFLSLNRDIDRKWDRRRAYDPVTGITTLDPDPSSFLFASRGCLIWSQRVKDEIVKMIPEKRWMRRKPSGVFPSGASADGGTTLADKLNQFAQYRQCLDTPLYPLGTGARVLSRMTAGKDAHQVSYCKLKAVNKSYKTARIIAPEDVDRQYDMQSIRIHLMDVLKRGGYDRFFDPQDQERNQKAAQVGSIDGSYATIDLSSASDSISRNLASLVLPEWYFNDCMKVLPTHIQCDDGTLRRLNIFATSGAAVTFNSEAVIFLGIIQAVRTQYKAYGVSTLEPLVYGDDLAVDTVIFDTVCDVLSLLGFTVNLEKSFASGTMYRESCGVEYSYGIDTSTRYFPRTSLDPKSLPELVASLCSLEHRLYNYNAARRFLCQCVRHYYPNMTSHEPCTDCADLWEAVPQFKVAYAPVKKGTKRTDSTPKRERHYTLVADFPDNTSEALPGSGWTRLMLVEMWLYAHFLEFGASQSDPLLSLLHVTEEPGTRSSLTAKAKTGWTTTVE